MKIEQQAFAAVDTRAEPKPHIMAWTVSGSAQSVRRMVGKGWQPKDAERGWKDAQKEGIRVLKITMRVNQ